MKNFRHFIDHPDARFLALEGRVAEVNNSVLEKFKKKSESTDENESEYRLREAKSFALQKMPTLSGEIESQIARHFNKPEKVEDTDSIKSLQKAVKSSVFLALQDRRRAPVSGWGLNYIDTVNSVQDTEKKAVLTIKDTDQALQAATSLKLQYERQAEVLLLRKSEAKRTERYGFLWKNKREVMTDRDRYSKGYEVAKQVFIDLETQFESKKGEAETLFKENKTYVGDTFEILSPEEKKIFVGYVKKEISGHFAIGPASPSWVRQVVIGMDFSQRVEIFKSLNLDPTKSVNKLSNQKNQYKSIESDLSNRREALEGDLVEVVTNTKLNNLKRKLKGIKKDESFDPAKSSNFQKFVKEMGLYLERNGDLGASDIFENYPEGEVLNDQEKMGSYLKELESRKDVLVGARMSKGLKSKFLTYIEYLQGVDSLDEVEGYSKDFLNEKNKVLSRYEIARDFPGTIEVDSIDEIDDDVYELLGIFVGESKGERQQYEKLKLEDNDLSESEIKLLDYWYSKIDEIIKLSETLRSEWEKSGKEFTKKQVELQAKVELAKEKVQAVINKKKLLGSEITILEDTVIEDVEGRLEKVEEDILKIEGTKEDKITIADRRKYKDLTKKQSRLERDIDKHQNTLLKKNEQLLGISTEESVATIELEKAKLNLEKFNDNTDSFDFTKVKTHFSETLAVLEEEIKNLKDPKYKEKKSNNSTDQQMRRHILEMSAELNNQQHQERIKQIQGETLQTLLTMPNGTFLREIEYIQYLHGREITAESAIDRLTKLKITNATILDQTDDAVILYDNGRPRNLIVIQKSSSTGKVEVISLESPKDFDPSTPLPMDYFPETGNHIGELTTIEA